MNAYGRLTSVTNEYASKGVRTEIAHRPKPAGPAPKRLASVVGLLLGTAAAIVGLVGPIESVPLRPWHAMVLLAFLVAVGARGLDSLARIRVRALDMAITVYLITFTYVEFYNATTLGHNENLGAIISMTLVFLGYVTTRLTIRDRRELAAFLDSFTPPAVVVGLLAVLQFVDWRPVEIFLNAATESEGAIRNQQVGALTRATSTIGHWTGLGAYLCVVIAAVFVSASLQKRLRLSHMITLSVSFLGVLSTLTISIFATAIATLLFARRRGGKIRRALMLATLTVVALPFSLDALSERADQQARISYATRQLGISWLPETLSARILIWRDETIPAISQRLSSGWGYDVYSASDAGWTRAPRSVIWPSAESQWLLTWITTGLAGLVTLTALVALAAKMLVALRSNERGIDTTPMIWMLAFTVVAAFTVPQFTNRGFPVAFWAVLGALAFALKTDTSSSAAIANQPMSPVHRTVTE